MKSQTASPKQTQCGFTLVEIIAALVIMTVLAIYAAPRIMGSNDVAAKVTADRVLAALNYAQMLAQRQGLPTSAVVASSPILLVTAGLTVHQSGVAGAVSATIQNYDGTATTPPGIYDALLHPDASFNFPISTVVNYDAGGIPVGFSSSITVTGNGMTPVRIKIEPTGYAHFE